MPNMSEGKLIASSSVKLRLEEIVGFGDVDDIFNDQVIPSEGGTIIFTIDVRRKFLSGDYGLHIVEVVPEEQTQVAILCREDVDPLKIHQMLIKSNVGSDFRCSNYLNRYDWMHSRNWGSDSEKEKKFKKYITKIFSKKFGVKSEPGGDPFFELVFFVNAEKIKEISNAEFAIERQNDYFFAMVSSAQKSIIGFIIHLPKDNKLILGDWNYGCVLQDKSSGKCFAFVLEDEYTNRWKMGMEEKEVEQLKEIGKNINYTFDIKDFLL